MGEFLKSFFSKNLLVLARVLGKDLGEKRTNEDSRKPTRFQFKIKPIEYPAHTIIFPLIFFVGRFLGLKSKNLT